MDDFGVVRFFGLKGVENAPVVAFDLQVAFELGTRLIHASFRQSTQRYRTVGANLLTLLVRNQSQKYLAELLRPCVAEGWVVECQAMQEVDDCLELSLRIELFAVLLLLPIRAILRVQIVNQRAQDVR